MKKRLLAGLIGLCVAFSVMPAVAFATGDTAVAKVTKAGGEVVGDYATFAEAVTVAQANEGSTVVLLEDVNLSAEMRIESGTFTIDLNGKQITIEGEFNAINVVGADVTFADDSGEGGIASNTGITAIAVAGNESSVVFDGGKYESNGNAAVLIHSGSVVVEDGSFEGKKRAIDNAGGTLTVEDGTFAAKVEDGDAISSSSNTTIADGDFAGRVVYHSGKLVFSGYGPWSQTKLCYGKTNGSSVELGENTVSLPDGYAVIADSTGAVVDTLVNGTLYRIAKTYVVTVSSEGCGTASASSVSGIAGTEVVLTATPDEGYQLKEWQVVSGGVTIADNKFIIGSADVEVKAVFEPAKYTITFDSKGGTPVEAITQDYGTVVTAPTNPTKAGHTFMGWSPAVPATMPAENVTLSAQWAVNKHDIVYVVDGVEYQRTEDVAYGTAITPIEAPVKVGHTFSGWISAPATMPDEDVTIEGSFTINQYTVTFDSKGGTPVEAITQDYGTVVTAPADPTKAGHNFMGWSPAVPATMPAENVTVTAQWAEYSIVEINGEAVDGNSGKGGVWTVGSAEGLTVRCSGDFALFKDLYIDGALVDKAHYDAREGSTVVTLKPEYLQGLSVDQHKLEFHYSDGAKVPVTLEIKAAPSDEGDKSSGNDKSDDVIAKTGDNSALPVVVFGVILAGAVAMFARRRIA